MNQSTYVLLLLYYTTALLFRYHYYSRYVGTRALCYQLIVLVVLYNPADYMYHYHHNRINSLGKRLDISYSTGTCPRYR
jgi:hypothetical protein